MKDKEKTAEKATLTAEDVVKKTRHRSPNYPYFGLKKAVERAKELHDKFKRSLVPIHLAQELWEYKPHSSAGNQAVAALKTYGLIEVEGEGANRKIRVTDSGYRILMGSPDRTELLKKAAIAPSLHSELWEKYKGENHFPDDKIIRHYLRWDRTEGTFNEEAVDAFIDNFRSSLRFSGHLPGGEESGKVADAVEGSGDRIPPLEIRKGVLVQWTSGGSDMFSEPREVLGISEDEKYAFVPGTESGLSVEELTVVGQTMKSVDEGAEVVAPPNPFKNAATKPPAPGVKEDVYDLPDGRTSVRYPGELDSGSIDELEEFFGLIVRKMRRTNAVEKKTNPKK